jgi:antitoxin component of RelBE/YafQ-DinJ toxin-antitoxin module
MQDEIKLETKGRKPYVKRISFTIRIDDSVFAEIQQYQTAHNLSKSKAVRELLTKGVKFGN